MISADSVQKLREKTGAGLQECKAALERFPTDPIMAQAWMKFHGCAINVRPTAGQTHTQAYEAWVLGMATKYAETLRTPMYPTLKSIPKLTRGANYHINVPLDYLQGSIDRYVKNYNLELNPEFQRGHVWTTEQQIKFIEFLAQGGLGSRDIRFNCIGWGKDYKGPMVLVDGLQRLTACLKFINNEIPIFGKTLLEYPDHDIFVRGIDLDIWVNDLKSHKEVLQWYLEINGGGTPHAEAELARVKQLLEKA